MKKSLIIIACLAVLALGFASCSQHSTCPAYRGSVALNETINNN